MQVSRSFTPLNFQPTTLNFFHHLRYVSTMRVLLSLVITVAAFGAPLLAAEPDYLPPKLLTGSIYDKQGGRLLFTFRRTATQTGDVVSVLREFNNPDGSLAALERCGRRRRMPHQRRMRLLRR